LLVIVGRAFVPPFTPKIAMTLTKVFCASLLALVLLGNAGCGQKGPLTLPTASAL
jgi:hypothetical protein